MQPVVERLSLGSPFAGGILQWASNVALALASVIQQFGYRLNRVAPKDGSEPFLGVTIGDVGLAPILTIDSVADPADNRKWFTFAFNQEMVIGAPSSDSGASKGGLHITRKNNNEVNQYTFEVGNSIPVVRIDEDATAGNTRLLVYDVDNATLERVSVGAANSGGAGFKLLRIPN